MTHGNCQPFEQWPSKAAAIAALTEQGLSTREIAVRMGVTDNSVYLTKSHLKAAGRAPKPKGVDSILRSLNSPAFFAAAEKRGISRIDLLLKIMRLFKREPSLIDSVC